MISANSAIQLTRRDLTVGTMLRATLAAAAAGCLLLGPVVGLQAIGTLALVLIGALWLLLSYRSLRGSRLAASSPSLIAAGNFEEAEAHLEQALRSFSLFRHAKVLALHNLAVLRHAQHRYDDAAQLCRALLRTRLGSMRGLNRPSRLLLADSLLELNDLRGAYDAMNALYSQRLSLAEALDLQLTQLDYLARIGAWRDMIANVMTQVQLAELMSPTNAARSQALLALAARREGRDDLSQWLRDRASLLVDFEQLSKDRPILWELWAAKQA